MATDVASQRQLGDARALVLRQVVDADVAQARARARPGRRGTGGSAPPGWRPGPADSSLAGLQAIELLPGVPARVGLGGVSRARLDHQVLRAVPAQHAPARRELGVEDLRQIARILARRGLRAVDAADVAGADQEAVAGAHQRQRLPLGQIDRQRGGAILVDAVDLALRAGGDEDAALAVVDPATAPASLGSAAPRSSIRRRARRSARCARRARGGRARPWPCAGPAAAACPPTTARPAVVHDPRPLGGDRPGGHRRRRALLEVVDGDVDRVARRGDGAHLLGLEVLQRLGVPVERRRGRGSPPPTCRPAARACRRLLRQRHDVLVARVPELARVALVVDREHLAGRPGAGVGDAGARVVGQAQT